MSKEMKIYLASQMNKTIGVKFDVSARKATKIDYTHDSEETRVSALEAVISEMAKLETESLVVPVQMFINSMLFNTIQNGYYKFWILTGKKSDGEEVSEEEIALWEAFQNLMNEKGLYVQFKNAFSAKIDAKRSRSRKAKITTADKQNDKYISYAWEKLKEIVGDSPDVDDDIEVAE